MTKGKIIEELKDLQSYIEDEWDHEDYADEIEKKVKALQLAIDVLTSGTEIAGTLDVNGEKYIVFKRES